MLYSSLMMLLPDSFRPLVDSFSIFFLGVARYAFGKTDRHMMFRTDV